LRDQTYLSNHTSDQAKIIIDTWNYIVVNFQVIWSLRTYYFRGSKLLDKPCQICQITSSCTVWNISRVIGGIFLRFKLGWKLDISSFLTINGRVNNSFKRKRTTCLKSRPKSTKKVQKLEIRAIWRNFSMKTLFLLSYFIYLILNNYF
jgi:hypothetical protein